MTPRPVAQYLTPFDAPVSPEASDDGRLDWEERLGQAGVAQDLAQQAQSARADAFAEGLAAGKQALEQALEAERGAFTARLESERASWAEEEGAKLGEALQAALASIEAGIAARVACILRPFIGAALRDRAIAELQEAIGVVVRADQMIEISGAPDLIASLRERLAGAAAAIVWRPNSATEVRVVADQTVIESRIGAWMQRIEARMEAS